MASATELFSSARRAPRVDFLGIGAQKAGTTWLHRMLNAHPDIFMAQAEDKDLRFFGACYDYGYQWYESHFAAAGGAHRRGEFSTSYLYCRDAPARVRRYNPNMRLLVSLRDPVKRLISHHKHEIRLGRLAGDLSLERGIANNPSYIEQSRYFSQLSRWLDHFPLTSFHIVIFEEVFAEPARAIRDLYEFVGVTPSFLPATLHEKINEGRIPRSRLLDDGVKLSTSALRALGAGWIVDSFKKAGADRWVRAGNARADDALALDEALTERLRNEFAAENAQLAALLGRDLAVWTGAAPQREPIRATA